MIFFFFFKQKTAYEISACLVGSEMCIRDSYDYEGGSNVVDVYIRYLRKKLDDGFSKKLLHTVRGAGYVLREEP